MTAKNVITSGMKFTKLTAIREISPDLWLCVCDCGTQKNLSHRNLTHGDSQSCGCLLREFSHKKHGYASEFLTGKKSPIYGVWKAMKERCCLVTSKSYKNYGAKGIRVCERWHEFSNFLADMGDIPAGLTLDRIDFLGNYEPDNCRWATTTTQARNRSITRRIEYLGEVRPVAEWSEITGINYNCLRRRLSKGWSIERALTTPVMTIYEVSALGSRERWKPSSKTQPTTP